MIEREVWMEIRILAKQGHSIKEIVRRTGLSRNTVRKYLRDESEPIYRSREPRGSKLDPFMGYLKARVDAASPRRLPATVLYREIRELGFDGCERLVRKHVSSLYPPPANEPVERFETAPGKQAQVDWCVFRRGRSPLSAFVATLGFSRYSYVRFVRSERFEELRACHESAFDYFGGVPHEVLYDNMRTVVHQRNGYGEGRHRFHSGLWDMARHFGFRPKLCRPYRAQTKGKVERFNRYLRNSFFYPLESRINQVGLTVDAELASAEVLRWLEDTANVRQVRAIGCRPLDRLSAERSSFIPLPRRLTVEPDQAACLHQAPWPRMQIQRSPKVYEQLLTEGVL